MPISFIITTYNILPYVDRCLESTAAVARPGDEVILVDDGSNDGTVERVQAFAAEGGFASGVSFRPIYLGANTIGGVGIGGNIGLSEARCDSVFFVDGDDWIDVEGFNRARAHWVLHPTDILITNYLEFNQTERTAKRPADAGKWRALDRRAPLETLRAQALAFIAVPWRKFYRRAFLEAHRLRFPEGDFFFEDNPFHWAVCMKAESIGFADSVVCHHRINRPGQTMASTGAELAAFFTHFRTILEGLPRDGHRFREAAARWLLGNMAWHIGRLTDDARPAYAAAAHQALKLVDDQVWEDLRATEASKRVWSVADRLRRGDIEGQIGSWERAAINQRLSQIEQRCSKLETQSHGLAQIAGLRRALQGQAAANGFAAISRARGGAAVRSQEPGRINKQPVILAHERADAIAGFQRGQIRNSVARSSEAEATWVERSRSGTN